MHSHREFETAPESGTENGGEGTPTTPAVALLVQRAVKAGGNTRTGKCGDKRYGALGQEILFTEMETMSMPLWHPAGSRVKVVLRAGSLGNSRVGARTRCPIASPLDLHVDREAGAWLACAFHSQTGQPWRQRAFGRFTTSPPSRLAPG